MSSTNINNQQFVEAISIYNHHKNNKSVSDSLFSLSQSLLQSFQSLLTYSVYEYYDINNIRKVDITSITQVNDDTNNLEILTNSPLFHVNKKLIKIPRKVEYAIRRHIPKELLYNVNEDVEVAIVNKRSRKMGYDFFLKYFF